MTGPISRNAESRRRILALLCVSVALSTLLACKDILNHANEPPTVRPQATPSTGPAPLAVAFASAAGDPDGTVIAYAWTFGDGGTSTEPNPTHMFSSVGNFTATVAVTDNGGAKTSASVVVAVSAPPNLPPTATALATPSSGTVPLSVSFTGGGTDPDGTIVAYSWMFGDGGSSTQRNPTHVYPATGNFTATLTVTDNGGATGSATVAITAGAN